MSPATAPPPPLMHAFRDARLVQGLAGAIAQALPADREVRVMEFCGGHTHALARHGLQDLLPPRLRLIHGPGCPVCVLPIGRVDQAIRLALEAGVNPNTVQRSLTELEREGLVFSQRTAGRFVTENENMITNAKLRIADERVGEFLHSMKTLGCTRDEVIALIQGAKEEEE